MPVCVWFPCRQTKKLFLANVEHFRTALIISSAARSGFHFLNSNLSTLVPFFCQSKSNGKLFRNVWYPGQHVGEKALTYHNYRFRNKVFCAFCPQLIKMEENKLTYHPHDAQDIIISFVAWYIHINVIWYILIMRFSSDFWNLEKRRMTNYFFLKRY